MIKVPRTFQSELVKLDVKFAKDLERLTKSKEPPEVQRRLAIGSAIRVIAEMNMFRTAEALKELLKLGVT